MNHWWIWTSFIYFLVICNFSTANRLHIYIIHLYWDICLSVVENLIILEILTLAGVWHYCLEGEMKLSGNHHFGLKMRWYEPLLRLSWVKERAGEMFWKRNDRPRNWLDVAAVRKGGKRSQTFCGFASLTVGKLAYYIKKPGTQRRSKSGRKEESGLHMRWVWGNNKSSWWQLNL